MDDNITDITDALEYKSSPTFDDAIDEYVKQTGSLGASDQCYIRRLSAQLGECKLALITTRTVDLLVTQKRRASGLKEASIRRELNTLQAVVNHAYNVGMIDYQLRLHKPSGDEERKVWLNTDKIREFIDICEPEFKPVAAFLFYTGARLGEALNARWEDMIDGCFIFRSRKGRHKKERLRSVPMHRILHQYLRPKESGLILTRGVAPWNRRSLYEFWNMAQTELGVDGLTPHCARHSFASVLILNGEDIRTVADLLGHTSLETTKRYTHLNTKHLKAAINKLPE